MQDFPRDRNRRWGCSSGKHCVDCSNTGCHNRGKHLFVFYTLSHHLPLDSMWFVKHSENLEKEMPPAECVCVFWRGSCPGHHGETSATGPPQAATGLSSVTLLSSGKSESYLGDGLRVKHHCPSSPVRNAPCGARWDTASLTELQGRYGKVIEPRAAVTSKYTLYTGSENLLLLSLHSTFYALGGKIAFFFFISCLKVWVWTQNWVTQTHNDVSNRALVPKKDLLPF